MRVAVISDVHANLEALDALSDVLDGVDRVICLGDVVGYYCQVNEVISEVRRREALCILGNHDSFLLRSTGSERANPSVAFGIEYAESVITPQHRRWLSELPMTWGGHIDGLSWLLVHGSPWRPLDDYMYADSSLLVGLDRFAYDFVAFGQTHRPLYRGETAPALLNPGSVGQSRHAPGLACAAVVDTTTRAVEMIERRYDYAPVLALARRNGAGEWIDKHFGSSPRP
jgi:putative phosphoesterase